MKTPEEIKRSMEHCAGSRPCAECAYDSRDFPYCIMRQRTDALAYIQQLEADNAQQARCIENMTDKLNATNEALPRWISVEDRLPEKHTGVIACCEDGYIAPMVYDGVHWNWNGKYEDSVTHWMHLPEPPKEDA